MKSIFGYAYDIGLIISNPAALVTLALPAVEIEDLRQDTDDADPHKYLNHNARKELLDMVHDHYLEIRSIIVNKILNRFIKEASDDGNLLSEFCLALECGNASKVEEIFTKYMKMTVSVRDTFIRKNIRENFYYGMLLGLLAYKGIWIKLSNKESGDEFSDIIVKIKQKQLGIVIELKYSDKGSDLEKDCKLALQQIEDKHYTELLHQEGYHKILKYGFACSRKKCYVMVKEENCELNGMAVF